MATASPLPNPEPQDQPLTAEGTHGTAVPASNQKTPFLIPGRGTGAGGKDNTNKMILILVGVVLLGLGFFALISTKGSKNAGPSAGAAGAPNLGRVASAPLAPGALVPQDGIAVSQNDNRVGTLEARDIEKTRGNPALRNDSPSTASTAVNAGMSSTPSVPSPGLAANAKASPGAKTLNGVAPFQTPNLSPNPGPTWTPTAYSEEGSSIGPQGGNGNASGSNQNIRANEEFTKPSMVFVSRDSSNAVKSGSLLKAEPDNFGLQSGYHVAARLESMASTALHAPVTAVIEYNYDRDGQILIPAGSRAVGRIQQADASGIVNIVFDSLEMPGGQTVAISAIGATTSLQAIKGNVTGKKAGQKLAIRALAGMGSTAAMMVGQNNVNGAISQGDMLRQRAADNIGSGADSEVMSMQAQEHIVVSVPAGTEVYLIFTKSQKISASAPQNVAVGRTEP